MLPIPHLGTRISSDLTLGANHVELDLRNVRLQLNISSLSHILFKLKLLAYLLRAWL